MSNSYICHFQIRHSNLPIMAGVVGYGGKLTKEQLRSDDSVLEMVLDNLYDVILRDVPISDDLSPEDLEVIMYLPDLVN